jgi:hypothetical protein
VNAPTIRLAATTSLMKHSDATAQKKYPFVDAPTVRLAATCPMMRGDPKGADRYPFCSPTVRLAATTSLMRKPKNTFEKRQGAPTIRLAHMHGAQGTNSFVGQRGVKKLPPSSAPALLVSYFYIDDWLKNAHRYVIRDWVLDSGAFSAKNKGITIDVKQYIEKCKELIDTQPLLTEIYALDVIGDWKATHANTKAMWKAGIPAIPCFHLHEPWDYLKGIAADYPKIAIGGMSRLRGKAVIQYAEQCFARVWPKPIHGFAVGGRDLILRLPWHSVDATNWELGPCGFGNWNAFGKLSVRGSTQDLRAEVEFYLDLERRARVQWKREMELLGHVPTLREQVKAKCQI